MRNTVRLAVVGLLVAAGFALAPAAFARGHVSMGVNIGLPGLSLGYSDCRHCYGGGYYGGGYYGGLFRVLRTRAGLLRADPVYYGPAYYGAAYDSYPVYRSSYYNGRGHYDSDRHEPFTMTATTVVAPAITIAAATATDRPVKHWQRPSPFRAVSVSAPRRFPLIVAGFLFSGALRSARSLQGTGAASGQNRG